jgi:hypothetical protein
LPFALRVRFCLAGSFFYQHYKRALLGIVVMDAAVVVTYRRERS